MSQAITDALRETRVRHVVALTTVAADRAGVPGPPAGLHEHERRLAGLRDTDLLVLRPTSYMDYLLGSLPLIRSQRLNGGVIEATSSTP